MKPNTLLTLLRAGAALNAASPGVGVTQQNTIPLVKILMAI